MKQILLAALLIFIGTATFAQKATLKGRITDAKSGEGLLGATVQIGSQGAAADLDGNYIVEIAAGKVKATFSFVGYDDVVKDINLAAGETKTIDIQLGEKVDVLKVVTVTSGKFDKPLSEVTVSMDVIKPTLIANSASASIDKALEKVPGVTIINGSANIRGGSGFSYGAGSRVLLLVNDIPALDPATGVPNFNDIPVENIEQVEVVKGAASALYGSSALNGIINVRTAFAKSKPYTAFATFATGYDAPNNGAGWWLRDSSRATPHEIGGYAAHRQKFGKFDLAIGSYWFQQKSFRKGEENQYYRFNAYTRYRFSEKLHLGLNFNGNTGRSQSFFIWNGRDDKSLEPLQVSDGPPVLTASKVLRYMIDPYITFMPNQTTTHKLQSRFSHITNDNGNNQANDNNFMYGEYQFTKRVDSTFTIVAGGVGSRVDIFGKLYGFSAIDTTKGANFNATNLAAYVQLDKKFHLGNGKWNFLNVSVGGRYEYNKQYNDSLVNFLGDTDPNTGAFPIVKSENVEQAKPVFRAGINYQPAEYTWIRASAGQGYRYPSIAERFIQTRVSVLAINPNPGLQAETGNSAEIAIKQGFKVSDWKGYVDVAGFYNEYANMMEFTLGGLTQVSGFQSVNIGDTQITGAELTVAGQGKIFGKETTLLAGYTYIDPKFKDFNLLQQGLISDPTQNVLKYRFRHTIKLDMETRINKLLSAGVSYQYNSRMENADIAFVGLEGFTDILVPGMRSYWLERNDFTLFDARVAFYPSDAVKISFLAKNILNQAFYFRPALMEAPRNFTLRADFTF
jgi:outer membrane receptor protein involved in Fe transport